MAAKFRKIDPRIWHDERFITLSNEEKLLAVYCLTAQCNRCGLFVFSMGKAAEDLGTSGGTFRERFGRVVSALRWRWDEARRVLYFPTWWKYNPPENINVLRGSLKDADDLPETPLLTEFYSNTRYLPKPFAEVIRERLANVPETLPPTVTESGAGARAGTGDPPNPPEGGTDEQPVAIPAELDTEDFRAAWTDWKAERKAKRTRAYTPKGEAQQLAKLAPFGPAESIRAIRDSIAQGWQGLFPKTAEQTKPRGGFQTPGERVLLNLQDSLRDED